MGLQAIGGGMIIPRDGIAVSAAIVSTNMSTANSKLYYVGRFFHHDYTAKTVTGVIFRFGSITKSSGTTTLRVGLQDVDLTNGPPGRGDGTFDQSYTIANADAGWASNVTYTATLGATRSLTYGDLICVAFDFPTYGGSDNSNITGQAFTLPTGSNDNGCLTTLETAGPTYTAQSVQPNIIFVCDDGTFGSLDGAYAFSAISNQAYNSGSAPNEYGLEFVLPFPVTINGVLASINVASGADFRVNLYNGDSLMSGFPITVDANATANTGNRLTTVSLPPTDLLANTTYRLSLEPTTANNLTLQYYDVGANGHFGAHPAPLTWLWNSRSGTWGSPTNTRRPVMALRFSGFHDGISGSGGVSLPRVFTGY